MEALTERQRLILSLIIHEYVKTANPVASQQLVQQFKLNMSSATVRNELAELTTMGFLRQPHTSAGRVPTEEGYKFFVSRLIQDTTLPEALRSTISHQFYQMHNDIDQWMRLAASVLAHQSQAASLVTAPHAAKILLKHVELISTRGTQMLMVIVLFGGELHQDFFSLANPVSQEVLSMTAARLTDMLQGLDPEAINKLVPTMNGLEKEVTARIINEMSRSDTLLAGEIYLDGLSNVLAEPEFASNEEARRALQVLEERPLLEDLLAHTMLDSSIGGVQVLIGGEGKLEELRHCSIVLSRYGTPGHATGTLGVLGPMRMSYGRSISVVKFISGLLSNLVSDTLIEKTS